jgi:energy-coupling factor transporter transmembrane protein EcfT
MTIATINDIGRNLLKQRFSIDPRTKIVVVLTILTSVLYSSNIYLLGSLTLLSLFLVFVVRAKIKFVLLSIFFLSLFSLVATLLANMALAVENAYLLYVIILCRFVSSFLIMSWFFYSVEPYELAISLERMFIPAMLVWFIITIYQFIPVTTKEAKEVNDIRKIKGLTAKRWQIRRQFYNFKKTLKPLITGSINRGIDLAESMTIKGFIPKRRKNVYLDVRIRILDIIALLILISSLVLVILFLKV